MDGFSEALVKVAEAVCDAACAQMENCEAIFLKIEEQLKKLVADVLPGVLENVRGMLQELEKENSRSRGRAPKALLAAPPLKVDRRARIRLFLRCRKKAY